jgi:hypothetical protein
MNTVSPEPARILNEDLMIVHATLAAIVDEVERYSGHAAQAVTVAMEQVHAAQHTLAAIGSGAAVASDAWRMHEPALA